MAYVSSERKAVLMAEVAKVLPKKDGWKWTMAVRNGATAVLTITQGPVDLVESYFNQKGYSAADRVNRWLTNLNPYYLTDAFEGEAAKLMGRVKDAMNTGNYDNSDIQTDYFDVGWYVDIKVGKYGDPFLHVVLDSPEAKEKRAMAKFVKKFANKTYTQSALKPYLPVDFDLLSPGRKAAATKKAKMLAGVA